MPHKNSLIALDEEALPVISNRKKAIADVVVRVLSLYYKKKKIATKVSHIISLISVHSLLSILSGAIQAVC